MPPITIKLSLVIFCIDTDSLYVYMPHDQLPSEPLSKTSSIDEQVEKLFYRQFGFPLGNNYAEQLYTFSTNTKDITIAYYVLLEKNVKLHGNEKGWNSILEKKIPESEIISYTLQRLRWKIEYTNVIYSLLPKTFTLSDLQKTYEIILGEKLDKRNFRKKILSLNFLKPTGEKRIINSRPALLYTFTRRTPQLVKVFS